MLPQGIRERISAHIIRVLVPLMMGGGLLSEAVILFFTEGQYQRQFAAILLMACSIPAWLLMKKGRPLSGVRLVLFCFILAIVGSMALSNGIQAPAYTATLVAVTLYVVLYGLGGGILFGTVIFLLGLCFVWLDRQGILPKVDPPPDVFLLSTHLIFMVFQICAVWIPVRLMLRYLTESRRLTQSLEEQVKERTRDLEDKNKKLKLFYFMVDQSPNALVITDTSGKIEFVNPAFSRSTGYASEELIGQNPRMLKSGKMPDAVYTDLWQTVTRGGTWTGELINKKKNGQFYCELTRIAPIKADSGETTHFLGIKEDISDRKSYEEALRQAIVKADNASRAKTEFIANMSHEIRTPMNAVIGMGHLMAQTNLNRRQKVYVNKLNAAAGSLSHVINDLLDFSKIEHGKIKLAAKPFSLDRVLEELTEQVTSKAGEKGIEFSVHRDAGIPGKLMGDARRLGQILMHLSDNAVKFTDHGRVTLHIAAKVLENGRAKLKFAVQDTGIGMTEEKIGSLFQAFSQADGSSTRKFGGAGLGLAICKRLVEQMGGEIWAESRPASGSTFSFTAVFTLGEQKETDGQAVPGEPDNGGEPETGNGALDIPGHIAGARVLLAEDNPVNQQLTKELLHHALLSVTIAKNGAEAMEKVSSDVFDAVVMDIQMPVMDGIAATKAIRRDGRFSGLPVIAMTAQTGADQKKKCLAAGMNDHVAKPIRPGQLYAALARWIKPGERDIPPELQKFREHMGTSNELLPDLPGFDTKSALQRFSGNVKSYKKSLGKSVDYIFGLTQEISENLEQNDRARAAKAAHSLKGLSGNIGAVRLYDLSEELEAVLSKKGGEPEKDVIQKVYRCARDAVDTIESLLDADKGENDNPLAGRSDMALTVKKLRGQIENFDASAGDTCDELAGALKGTPFEAGVKEIEKSLGRYEFERAGQWLDKLMNAYDSETATFPGSDT